MPEHRYILTGLGNIGRNFLAITRARERLLAERYGVALRAVGVADSSGALYDPAGLDLDQIIALKQARQEVAALATASRPLLDVRELVASAEAAFLLEATPTNLRDGQPGLDLVRTALRRGLHAVLASKGPLVLAYQELVRLTRPGTLAFSGAVCGGLPTVNVGQRDLAASHIRRVDGIFNSTTQVILGLLAAGQPYTAALAASTAGGRLSLLATAEESAGSYAPRVAPVALPAIPWPGWRSMRWPLSTTPTSTAGLW
jgi:homoserine dehydrogenase